MNTLIAKLRETAERDNATDLRAAFAADPERFSKFSVSFEDLLMDFSKTAINDEILDLLVKLADEAGVAEKRASMFAGEKINITENRAVLHTALRNRAKRRAQNYRHELTELADVLRSDHRELREELE